MKTTDFNQPVTSAKLKENLEKRFGTNVNLNKYNREQLEDIRNKFRTKIFQQEGSAGINDLLANETYQKDKAMLELLNTRIKEMLGENLKQLKNKMIELSEAKTAQADKKACPPMSHIKKMCQDGKTVAEICKMHPDCDHKELKQMVADCKEKMNEAKKAKPDFLDMDKDGNKKEPMKKAVKDAKVKETIKKDSKELEGNEFSGELVKAKAQHKDTFKVGGKEYNVKEGFPTVADAKARAEKEKTTGKFDKKETSTGTVYTKKHTKSDAEHKPEKKVKEGAKHPSGCDCKACKMTKGLKEANANFKHNVNFVNESLGYLLSEDEEGKAKAITAAGDMVNDFTSWMQRVGQYQTKSMIELADAIRADFGQAEAEAFKQAVGPALSATLEVLTQQREAVSNAVASLAGEAVPETPMGMEPEMGPTEPGMDTTEPDMMNPEPEDEFGASDAAAGMGTTGREMRESRARKLAESHSIMSKLAR